MRWFCVAPALPTKAALRIRTAPNSGADVCGRFTKGKAIAAFTNVIEICDENDPESSASQWLHVAFQDENTRRWSEGYVMASLPDGMTLVVPWEEAGFLRCCTVEDDRASLYDSPAMSAQIVGTVDAGEGTRFPYGVYEMEGDRLRIFHDVHESVWVNAEETETVCEKIEHANCTVSHSFFSINEELPPEAQIAIRAFPSREAETLALLSRGQVVAARARCGNWLQLASADGQDSWIMWQTDTWQLLTELPLHTADACRLVVSAAPEIMRLEETIMGSRGQVETAPEEHEVEAQTSATELRKHRLSRTPEETSLPSGETQEDVGTEATSNHECITIDSGLASELQAAQERQQAVPSTTPVTNLCEELASSDISSSSDVQRIPAEACVDASSNGALAWDERPLNVNRQQQASDADEHPTMPWDDMPLNVNRQEQTLAAESTAAMSWDERPLNGNHQRQASHDDEAAAMLWDDMPLNVNRKRHVSETEESATLPQDEMPLSATSQPETKENEVEEPQSFPEDTDQIDTPMEAEATEAPSLSWEDRPITAKSQGIYNWESEIAAVDQVAEVKKNEPSFAWEDQPIAAKSRETYDWESSLAEHEQAPVASTQQSRTEDGESLPVIPPNQGSLDGKNEHEVSHDSVNDVPDSTVDDVGDAETVSEEKEADEPDSIENGAEAIKEWHWEEAPIKSRHALKAAHDVEGSETNLEQSPIKSPSQTTESLWKTDVRGNSPTKLSEAMQATASGTASSEGSPKQAPYSIHAAVGVVVETSEPVVWHSREPVEDHGAFDESNELSDSAAAPHAESPMQHSPMREDHTSHSAIGVLAPDSSIAGHSLDTVDAPGATDDAIEAIEDMGDIENVEDQDIDSQQQRTDEEDATDAVNEEPLLDSPVEVDEIVIFGSLEQHVHDEESEEPPVSGQDERQDMIVDDVAPTDVHELPMDDDQEMGEGTPIVASRDAVEEEIGTPFALSSYVSDVISATTIKPASPAATGVVSLKSRLKRKLTSMASDRQDNRILQTIAFDEGPDAILEALAAADSYDAVLSKYVTPNKLPTAAAPSPATSESGLLDVLYSRDQGDAFSTPKKRPLSASKTPKTPSSPYAVENKTELLAGILRRTPQKSRESHSKIVNNANAEDILEAEFGGCADELGLFGDYRYPAVPAPRFSSGQLGTPTRATSLSMSSLQSPSFGGSSSFSSPVPKENPLKRSAAAIAKTPPVALSKSAAPPQPMMPPPPPPPSPPPPPPIQVPPPSRVVEKSIALRTKAFSSNLLPPSTRATATTTSALPRPSLAAPSQLRRPVASAMASAAPPVARTRSFTTSDEAKPRIGGAATATSAPIVARSQSMLPRKSMLPAPSPTRLVAPSPSKFGLSRTSSLSSATASSAGGGTITSVTASATATPSLLSRRTSSSSFGFSRPTPTKKP